jgi:hypothetical protein
MMAQFAKSNTQIPLLLFGRSLHAVITWTSVQRRYLIERLGFPSERVDLVRHFVDQLFYSPRDAELSSPPPCSMWGQNHCIFALGCHVTIQPCDRLGKRRTIAAWTAV